MDFYRFPGGGATFEGSFQAANEDYFFNMKGQLTGYNLEGTLFGEGLFEGSTISGVLSRDENSLNGVFALNTAYSPKENWNAQRK